MAQSAEATSNQTPTYVPVSTTYCGVPERPLVHCEPCRHRILQAATEYSPLLWEPEEETITLPASLLNPAVLQGWATTLPETADNLERGFVVVRNLGVLGEEPVTTPERRCRLEYRQQRRLREHLYQLGDVTGPHVHYQIQRYAGMCELWYPAPPATTGADSGCLPRNQRPQGGAAAIVTQQTIDLQYTNEENRILMDISSSSQGPSYLIQNLFKDGLDPTIEQIAPQGPPQPSPDIDLPTNEARRANLQDTSESIRAPMGEEAMESVRPLQPVDGEPNPASTPSPPPLTLASALADIPAPNPPLLHRKSPSYVVYVNSRPIPSVLQPQPIRVPLDVPSADGTPHSVGPAPDLMENLENIQIESTPRYPPPPSRPLASRIRLPSFIPRPHVPFTGRRNPTK